MSAGRGGRASRVAVNERRDGRHLRPPPPTPPDDRTLFYYCGRSRVWVMFTPQADAVPNSAEFGMGPGV